MRAGNYNYNIVCVYLYSM